MLTITGVQTLRKGCQMYQRERQSEGEGGLRATEMGVLLTSTEGHAALDAAHDAAHGAADEHSKRARSPRASSETLAAAPAPACREGAGAAAGSQAALPPP